MGLAELVNSLVERRDGLRDEEIEKIINDPGFEANKEDIISAIKKGLEYPNLNALKLASEIPNEAYSQHLLKYSDDEMTECQTIQWMFALGKIRQGLERIERYTSGNMAHEAFISMGAIDIKKTMELFESYLDKHCEKYVDENETKKADSGYWTLYVLLDYKGAEKELKKYDLTNTKKYNLVKDALAEFKGDND